MYRNVEILNCVPFKYIAELILGFVEKGPTPPVFPKGGQPANQMGNGVFLKKMRTSPSPLKKKLSPHLKKNQSTPKRNRAGVVFRCWPVLFTPPPNHNNPGLQKCWKKTEGEEWEGYLI